MLLIEVLIKPKFGRPFWGGQASFSILRHLAKLGWPRPEQQEEILIEILNSAPEPYYPPYLDGRCRLSLKGNL